MRLTGLKAFSFLPAHVLVSLVERRLREPERWDVHDLERGVLRDTCCRGFGLKLVTNDERFERLDVQMAEHAQALREYLRLGDVQALRFASFVGAEMEALSAEQRCRIREASPVPFKKRFAEMTAFQAWMDVAGQLGHPVVRRAQVQAQLYFCFVYLGDGLFKALKGVAASGTTVARACKFLLDNPVRALRNAVAHGNWSYADDFGAIDYWARKGAGPNDPIVSWRVPEAELQFWQVTTRCTAYVALFSLRENETATQ